jgi:MYXO-CTERM domain-containing protein
MANTETHSKGMSTLLKLAMLIAIIGAVNWGLIGFFNWNLVDAIFGGDAREMTSTASRVVYALVGLSGLVALASLRRISGEHDERHPAPSVPYGTR